MTRTKRIDLACIAALVAAASLCAQDPTVTPPVVTAPVAKPLFTFDFAFGSSGPQDDFWETYGFGGFRFRWPTLDMEVRGQNGLLLSDRTAVQRLVQGDRSSSELPTRGPTEPKPRRAMSTELLHKRAARLLGAMGGGAKIELPPGELAFEAPRFLYFEGGVEVFRQGVLVARCERMWISPLDDRIVVEDAELRWRQDDGKGGPATTFVVRGKKLEKQGARWVGRDLTLTSCEAGEPHAAIASGELELVEREGQFEVWSRGNTLVVGGVPLLPLPSAHFFSAEQSGMPIRGVRLGYSGVDGVRTEVELGMPYQGVGGSVHEWLTGRPAHEFRGEWNLGLGWIESRGFPVRGDVDYGAKGLYQGKTEGFWMEDDGPNRREITKNIDGTVIDDRERTLLRTENRVFLGERTNLDVQAFTAGDAAVYSEFYRNDYRSRELPESSAYLHHAWDNVLVTMTGRFQADDFSYRDDRSLSDSFTEELPVATLHWLSQPIAETPWETPIVLDAETEVGQRRLSVNRGSPLTASEDTKTRADQIVELSAPFHVGPVTLRPFAQGRLTHYDEDALGDSADRWATTAGVRAGSRFSRTWNWLDEHGREQALRHVVSPILTVMDRMHVSGDPTQFEVFDPAITGKVDDVDSLSEQNLVRFEVRNLVQRTRAVENRPSKTEDVVFLDLAQDFWPDRTRTDGLGAYDGGLGLFYYDFLVRPEPAWWPTDGLALGVYGDQDWDTGLRTLDAELMIGRIAGLDWSLDYRTDRVVNGAAGIGAKTQLLGNWDVQGNVMYDLERDDVLTYYAGLRRDDHDWSLLVGMSYDPFLDQVVFRIDMEPRLFGRGRARNSGWFGPMGDNRLYPTDW